MSIKTLRKRIALVAVSALGVGLLSVAPASASSSGTPGDGVATIVSGTVCVAVDDFGTAGAAPHISGGAATNDQNLTVPVGGTLVLGLDADDNAVLRGPIAAINLNFDGANDAVTNSLNAAGLVLLDDPGATDEDVLLSALSVGSASIVVSADGASTLGVSTRANTINITIVASCVTATVSDADTVVDAGSRNATPAVACQTAAQVARGTDVTTYAAGEAACITAVVKNAYGVVVPSDTFAVTATNGALVNMDGTTISLTSPDVKGSTSFDTATADGTDVFVRVDAPSGAAMSTVVTISYAGQVVATKTLTWRGEATKINVLASSIGKTSGQGQIHYTLTDAAGNLTAGNVTGLVTSFGAQVTSTTDSANTANYTVTEPLWATAGKGATFSSAAPAAVAINGVAANPVTSATYGILLFNCGSTSGSATITIRHYQPVTGAYISTPVTVSCAGGVDTYTVSADKASYKVGEVATFTITAKDSKGNPVHDYLSTNNAALGTGTAADVSFGGGAITKATSTSDPIGVFASQASGTAVYKAQLTTAGSFNAVVNLGGSTTKSVTVSYTIADGAVSNAEVLAAIVKLIASINAQIKALQKSLKR
jgi:hypothetical protein